MTYFPSTRLPTLIQSAIILFAIHGAPAAASKSLPDLGPAPELISVSGWINSPPLTLAALRGNVVLVQFWTYSCINCVRTLPHISRWHKQYQRRGMAVIGVHTPEHAFERDAGNLATAVKRFDINYPVVQDNHYATWQAYSNQYWPAVYLIDRKGRIRYKHFGEGEYQQTDRAIQLLLEEK